MAAGPLVILSGPSGVGKSTLIKRLLADGTLPLRLSVSATTRDKRPGEQEGVNYYFWGEEQFRAAVEAGEFLEHAVVHGVHHYGTLKREVERLQNQGFGVVLDIDVQGARLIRERCKIDLSVFIRTSTFEELERRLRDRHTESEEAIQRRLATAREELTHQAEYHEVVVNDDIEEALARLKELIARAFEARAGAN